MYKKILAFALSLVLIIAFQANVAAAAAKQPSIILDGKTLSSNTVVRDGCLYLPLRAVAEELGFKVAWTREGNIVSLSKGDNKLTIGLNDHMAVIHGHSYYIDGDYSGDVQNAIIFIENRTYVGKELLPEILGLKALYDEKNNAVTLEREQYNNISIETIKDTSEDKYLKLTIQYPQVSGLESKEAEDSINKVLKEAAEHARQEGLQYADEMKKSIESGYNGSPNKCETFFNYILKYNSNDLLSIVLDDYQYTGGAHGMTLQTSHTFSLKDGADYKLSELFKSGSDHVSAINTEVKLQMAERVKAGILPEQPLTPFETIKPDQDYYLSESGVVIYFQQYEYFPYAAGIQEFVVPYEKLKSMLKDDFSILASDNS